MSYQMGESQPGVHPRPDREEAERHRRDRRLYQHARDSNGVPIMPPVREQFSLLSYPKIIGLESVGLGIYLYTLMLFLALLVALTLLSLIPIGLNLNNNKFSTKYALRNLDNPVIDTLCDRSYQPAWLPTNVSPGAACSPGTVGGRNPFTNAFDCPAVCTVDTERAASAECAAVTPEADPCLSYRSCDIMPIPGTPGANLTESCLCCNIVLHTKDLYPPLSASVELPFVTEIQTFQLWMPVLVVLVFFVWSMFLLGMQQRSADDINQSVITAGDYAVWIKGLGSEQTSTDEIIAWAAHYGEVVAAVPVLSFSRPLALGKSLDKEAVSEQEIRAAVEDPIPPSAAEWLLYKYYWFCLGGDSPKALAKVHARQAKLKTEMQHVSVRELRGMGEAVVVFNYECHASNCVRDHHRGWLGLLGPLGGVFSDAPKFNGMHVRVLRAPEPSDFWWSNADYRGIRALRRRFVSGLVLAAALVLAALIQLFFGQKAEQERSDRLTSARNTSADSDVDTLSFNSLGLRFYSILSSVVVVLLNGGVSCLAHFLSHAEKYATKSEREKWHVLKLSVLYVVNSFAIPVAVAARVDKSTWYSSGGLVEQAFYLQITNAFLPDLVAVINIGSIIQRVTARFCRTQKKQNIHLEPASFALAERYASAVKTLSLAVLYAPILPISPFIGLLGVATSYAADQYIALRKARKPHALGEEVTGSINTALKLLPLCQVALVALYFQTHEGKGAAVGVGITLWFLLNIFPWQVLFGLKRGVDDIKGGTGGLPFMETIAPLGQPAPDADRTAVEDAAVPDVITANASHYRPEIYSPKVFSGCPEELKTFISKKYGIPESTTPAVSELLDGQKLTCGGPDVVEPPPRGRIIESVQPTSPAAHPGAYGLQASDPAFYPVIQLYKPAEEGAVPHGSVIHNGLPPSPHSLTYGQHPSPYHTHTPPAPASQPPGIPLGVSDHPPLQLHRDDNLYSAPAPAHPTQPGHGGASDYPMIGAAPTSTLPAYPPIAAPGLSTGPPALPPVHGESTGLVGGGQYRGPMYR